MYWRFPSRLYFKKGCFSVALNDFVNLEQKKVKIVFSNSLTGVLKHVLKKVKQELPNKEVEIIEDINLNKRITNDHLVIVLTGYTHIAKVRSLIDDNTNTMIVVPPFFSIGHLGSQNSNKEIIIADLALFNNTDKDFLLSTVRGSLWNTLTISLQYTFLEQLSKKKNNQKHLETDLDFLFQIGVMWKNWFVLCDDCVEKVFHSTLLASIELMQQTNLFINLDKYEIKKRIKTISKLKEQVYAELSNDQLEILESVSRTLDLKINSQKTYDKFIEKVSNFY